MVRHLLRDLWDRVRPLPAFADPLVVVRETAEQNEALLIAGMLRDHGIAATVRVSEQSPWVPSANTGWAVVLVPHEDEVRACHLLDDGA